MFLLAAAWLFLPCAAMVLDVSVPVEGAVEHDHDHDHSSSPSAMSEGGSSPSAASTSSSSTSSLETALQRRRSASPWCFGTRGGDKKKGAASAKTAPKGGDVVSTRLGVDEEPKGRRQGKSGRSPPDARSVKAFESGSSSPASSMSSPSPGGPTGFGKSQPPCFGTGAHGSKLPRGSNGAHARSPAGKQEAKGGGGVGSYIREISRRLRHGTTEKPPPPPPPPTRTVVSPFGERKRGNAIASEEEMRAFVLASAKNLERNGPPTVPRGLV